MADETKAQADTATATAKAVDSATQTATQTAKTAADEGAKTATAGAKSIARATDRVANATKATKAPKARAPKARAPKARKATKTPARRAKTTRTAKNTRTTAKAKPAAARKQRNDTVTKTNTNTNLFGAFEGFPTVAPFQSLFADAGERSQAAARRSQQATEEFADIARGNVEALVEASRLAAEGARSIGQDVIAKSRSSVEQTADAIRSLAEAKSPTELVQLQGEYARASFDRMVSESSKLTESLVKLAGEAIQPISNRASATAQRFNSFVA